MHYYHTSTSVNTTIAPVHVTMSGLASYVSKAINACGSLKRPVGVNEQVYRV